MQRCHFLITPDSRGAFASGYCRKARVRHVFADHLALILTSTHEFKSVTIAGAAAQDSSNPDSPTGDWRGEFWLDRTSDLSFTWQIPRRPAFADIERPTPHRGALLRGGHVQFGINS
jgi:hypothetical protein